MPPGRQALTALAGALIGARGAQPSMLAASRHGVNAVHSEACGVLGRLGASITPPQIGWLQVLHAPCVAAALHSSSAARSDGRPGERDAEAGAASTAAQERQQPTSTSAPVQNPLQAILESAAGGPMQPGGAGRAQGTARRPTRRTWLWYDETDEREERKKELRAARYMDVGTAYMLNADQSMKKFQRIIKLVRGLHYEEAITQCQMTPQKAAKLVVQALEEAKKDAVDNKGLRPELLVVGEIFVTKGIYEKRIQPMGKGGTGKMVTRKCHVRVVLREDPKYSGFRARLVAPIMSRWQQHRTRPRHQYRMEV